MCVEWGSVAGKRPGASQTGNSRVSRRGSVRRSGREEVEEGGGQSREGGGALRQEERKDGEPCVYNGPVSE